MNFYDSMYLKGKLNKYVLCKTNILISFTEAEMEETTDLD